MMDKKNEIIKDYIKSQGYTNIVANGFTIVGYKGNTRLSVEKLSDSKVSISKTILSDYDELIKAIEMTVPIQIARGQDPN